MKDLIILLLCAIIYWFGSALIRVENERYALRMHMCQNITDITLFTNQDKPMDCSKVQTRTSPLAHLFYGLQLQH